MTAAHTGSVLAGTAGLSALLLVAVAATLARPRLAGSAPERQRFLVLLAAAIAAQATHFGEELATGFPARFPASLGLAPWPAAFFVWFNLAWLALWALAAFGLRRGIVAALAPTWFLALALAANGIAHPLLALRERGYFPGLVTAPLVGVLGVALLRGLGRLTTCTPAGLRHTGSSA